jgi:hypothetical protein
MSSVQQTISPVDGSLYAERPFAAPAAIDAVFDRAVTAQRDWARRSVEERAVFGNRFCDALLSHGDEIAMELAWSMGRPVAQAPGEVRGCVERARFMVAAAEEGLAALDPGPKAGFKRYVKRVPLGVVFVIAPWNYPFLTAVNTIIPAIMAGNTVVLKHAAQTQLVAEGFSSICIFPVRWPRRWYAIRAWRMWHLPAPLPWAMRSPVRRRTGSFPWGWSWAGRTLLMFGQMRISALRRKTSSMAPFLIPDSPAAGSSGFTCMRRCSTPSWTKRWK